MYVNSVVTEKIYIYTNQNQDKEFYFRQEAYTNVSLPGVFERID